MIDLTQFVGNDEYRAYLNRPFSIGEYSYASNGHIMVRVARRPDVAVIDLASEKHALVDKALEGQEAARWAEPAPFSFPDLGPPEMAECSSCFEGKEHDCPDCECICEVCDGSGHVAVGHRQSVCISGVWFDAKYVRLLMALPAIEIDRTGATIEPIRPLYFRFIGGIGVLMPLRDDGRAEGYEKLGEIMFPPDGGVEHNGMPR